MNFRHTAILAGIILFSCQIFAQRFGLSDQDENKSQIPQPMQNVPQNSSRTQQQIVGLESPINPDEYLLGPGDGFSVSILAQTPMQFQVQVSPVGKIAIPGVGSILVIGKNITQAESSIVSLVKDQYKNSKVEVTFSQIRNISCFISGAVQAPGKYELRPVDRIDDLVQKAGGMTDRAFPFQVKLLRTDGEQLTLDLMEFQHFGDLSQNPKLEGGDRVIVPPTDVVKDVVILRSGFQDEGMYPLQPGETLKNLLDHYGKYISSVEIKDVAIFRKNRELPIHLDVYTEADTFHLKSGDEIQLGTVRGVIINGYVNTPGRYPYMPGFSVSDYIAYAGGVTPTGALNRTTIIHPDGSRDSGLDIRIQRGDIIIVPESRTSVIVGDISFLQIITSVVSVFLAYVAATK